MGPQEQIDVLLQALRPNEASNDRRKAICAFVERVVQALLPGVRLMGSGSYTSRTYLPTSDIDLVLFTAAPDDAQNNHEMNYILQVFQAICLEISARDAAGASAMTGLGAVPMTIRNAEFINARTKVCHCLVNNLGIDITINQVGALKTVVFIEECDVFIGQNHLFKRAVLLVKAWAMLDSPEQPCASAGAGLGTAAANNSSNSIDPQCTGILGSKTGMLSSYAVSVLVLHLFNRFPALNHPLSVLHAFLHTYANFHWETNVLTVEGSQVIQNGQLKAENESASSSSSACVFLRPLLDRFKLQVESISCPTGTGEGKDIAERSVSTEKFGYAGTATSSLSSIQGGSTGTGSGGGLARARSGSMGNLNSTRRFSIRCCNILDPVDPTNNLGFSVSRNNLGILDRCLKSGLRRLNEALLRSSSYIHVKQMLPDEERGDIFNANGSNNRNSKGGSVGDDSDQRTDQSNAAGFERDDVIDMKFVEGIMPACYREYVACLGARADMLDHPLQALNPTAGITAGTGAHQAHGNGMLYAPKPVHAGGGGAGGGGAHVRYTSPVPYASAREDVAYALEEYLRALKTRQRSSSITGSATGGRGGVHAQRNTLEGNLSEMWAALHDEFARRDGTYKYTRVNISAGTDVGQASAAASVPVFHQQVPAPTSIPPPVSPDRVPHTTNNNALVGVHSPIKEAQKGLPPRPPVPIAGATHAHPASSRGESSDINKPSGKPSGVAIPKPPKGAVAEHAPVCALDSPNLLASVGPPRKLFKPQAANTAVKEPVPLVEADSVDHTGIAAADTVLVEATEADTTASDSESDADNDNDNDHIRSPTSAFAAVSGVSAVGGGGEEKSTSLMPGMGGIQRPTPIDTSAPPANMLQRRARSSSGSGGGSSIFNPFEALGSPAARTPHAAGSSSAFSPTSGSGREAAGGRDGNPETFIEPGSPEDDMKKDKTTTAGAGAGAGAGGSDIAGKANKKQKKKRSISILNTAAARVGAGGSEGTEGPVSQSQSPTSHTADATSAHPADCTATSLPQASADTAAQSTNPAPAGGIHAISHWSKNWIIATAVALIAFGMGSQGFISRYIYPPSGHMGDARREHINHQKREDYKNTPGRDMRDRHFAHSRPNKHSGEDDHKYDDDGQLIIERRSEPTRLSVRENLSSKLAEAEEKQVNTINGYQYAHSSSIAPFTHWLKAGSSLSIGPNDVLCPLSGVDLSAVYKAKRSYAAAKERGNLNLGAILESSETEGEDGDLNVSEEQYQLLLGAFLRDVDIVGDANGCPRFSPEPKWVWQHNGVDINTSNGYIYDNDSGYFEGGFTPILTIKNAQRTLVDSTVAQARKRSKDKNGNVAEIIDPNLTHEGVYSCVLRFGTAPYVSPHSKSGLKPLESRSTASSGGAAGAAGAAGGRGGKRDTSGSGAPYNPLAEAAAEMDAVPVSGRSRNTYSSILSKDGHLLGYNNDLGLTFAMKNKFSVGEGQGGKGGKMMVQDEYFEILVTQVAVRVSTMPIVTTKLVSGAFYELFEGQDLFIGVNAESFPPPSYQWYQNGNKIEGETRSFLQVIGVQLAHAGAYTCEISNLAGSVTFEDVSVSVKKAPHNVAHNTGTRSSRTSRSINQAHQHQAEQERANPTSKARQDALLHARTQAAQSQALRDELLKGGYPNLNSNPRPMPPRKRMDEDEEDKESAGAGGDGGGAGKRPSAASGPSSNLS